MKVLLNNADISAFVENIQRYRYDDGSIGMDLVLSVCIEINDDSTFMIYEKNYVDVISKCLSWLYCSTEDFHHYSITGVFTRWTTM